MLINYLKIALRNLLRHKSFSTINIAGLTIGLVSFLAISLYVVDEFSYDRFHQNSNRIYRAVINANFDGQTNKWGAVPNKLAPAAAKEIPEIEKAARVFHHNFGDIGFISTETDKFSENNLYYADPEIFSVFTIPLLKGNPEKVLARPGTVILSEAAAKRYFGSEDPIGKSLTVDNSLSLEVTGVYQNFPSNSYLQAEMLASFSSIGFGKEENQNWGNASFVTFFLLSENTSVESVNKKIAAMLEKNISKDDRWFSITLQQLVDIHLHSSDLTANIDRQAYGDMNQVKILIALACLILLIAAVNYMNLTTAQSQRRNKEVGISKTLGATFGELNIRFYSEAAFFVLLSLILSVAIFLLALPIFNSISGKNITIQFLFHSWFWISILGLWLLLSIISGFYPAFYLSSFSPKAALQKKSNSGGQASIRKGLVIFQFSISVMLIICAFMFYKQLNFIRNKKLGYQPEQVVAVMVSAAKDRDQVLSLKSAFESIAEVKKVARSQSYPGIGTSGYTLTREGSEQGASLAAARATHEILDVLNIKLLAGKTLPEIKDLKDTTIQVVINKAAADYLQLSPEEAVGKRVKIFGDQVTEVIGVSEDFHFASLHQPIGPYCFNNSNDNRFTYLLVKVEAFNLTATIQKLETAFKKQIPASFEYTFLDQQVAKLYLAEEKLSTIILLFAGLAVFIACLGLYALAAFTAEQRIKEIGIRKVLGATIPQLMMMLSKELLTLVLIAFLIGIPTSYYLMDKWLQGFAYRTTFEWVLFLLAGGVVITIAWATVSLESFKAAKANPVNNLRNE